VGKTLDIIARSRARFALLLIGAAPAALAAQTTNSTGPALPPPPSAVTAPDLQHYSLPTGQNTQTALPPLPTPTPTPSLSFPIAPPPLLSTLAPRTVAPVPQATSKASTSPKSRPSPTPTPAPSPEPSAVATSAATPSAQAPQAQPAATTAPASPRSAPVTPLAAPPESSNTLWWVLGAGAVILLLAAGWLFNRRRKHKGADDPQVGDGKREDVVLPPPILDLERSSEVAPRAVPEPVPVLVASQPRTAEREAAVAIDLHVRRAGLNLTSAAVEYTLEMRNLTDQPLSDVRVDIRMLTANERQAATIAAIFTGPIETPTLAPFALAPGSPVSLNGRGLLPLDSLSVLTVEERRFFVPVLAIRVLYARPNGSFGEVTSVQAVGIDRGDGQKLAPFRLDGPPRMFDRVAARPV
jgi:hypothetical protein